MGKRKGADYIATCMMLTTPQGLKVGIFVFGLRPSVLENKELDAIVHSIR